MSVPYIPSCVSDAGRQMIYYPLPGYGPRRPEPVQTSGEGYVHFAHPDGSSWVYLSRWTNEVERMLGEAAVPSVFLSEHWTLPTLDVLRPFAGQIERLAICSAAVTDFALLVNLPRLRTLALQHTSAGVPFARLHSLQECSIGSPATLGTAREAPVLETLHLDGLVLKDLRGLEGMTTLRTLNVRNARAMSLAGIETLALTSVALNLPRLVSVAPLLEMRLEYLKLANTRAVHDLDDLGAITTLETLELDSTASPRSLQFASTFRRLQRLEVTRMTLAEDVVSLRALSQLTTLREVELTGGKRSLRNLTDVEALGELPGLTTIHLHNGPRETETIRWVSDLRMLQSFRLQGTRIRDGDVSPLLSLPSVRHVAIMPTAKHYSHTNASFHAAMRAKHGEAANQFTANR